MEATEGRKVCACINVTQVRESTFLKCATCDGKVQLCKSLTSYPSERCTGVEIERWMPASDTIIDLRVDGIVSHVRLIYCRWCSNVMNMVDESHPPRRFVGKAGK